MNIILCGKSGSGKDFAFTYIKDKKYAQGVPSYTTRPPRENEVNGKDYYFIPEEQFEELVEDDNFAETRSYNTLMEGKEETWHYGTSRFDMEQDWNKVLIKDLEGAIRLKEMYPDTKIIYIYTDDKIREERAKGRGSFCQIEWDRRVEADAADFPEDKIKQVCDYYIYNDRSVDKLKERLDEILPYIVEGVE